MEHIYFETDRFIVRQWAVSDAAALYAIMSDEAVHRYTGDTPWDLRRAQAYIELMRKHHFTTLDVFHGACFYKETECLIGYVGLNPYQENRPEIEWQLGLPYWGKGYATELGGAVIDRAFKTTSIDGIYGMANPKNEASMRVMEKIGMRSLGLQPFRGHQDMFYYIGRGENKT